MAKEITKRIRLVVPFCEMGTNALIYLKVIDEHTKAFNDKYLTQPLPKTSKKISLELELPEKLETIIVIPHSITPPVHDISIRWAMKMANPNWKIQGLKKVSVIFNDMTHELKVIDERPDILAWNDYLNNDTLGKWGFMKKWALVIYTTETKTLAVFHWHSELISI